MSVVQRIAIAALATSAAAFVATAVDEGYTGVAVVPVKGDVWTNGFGSTTRADGSPVREGDRTDPVKALQRTLAYRLKADQDIRGCVTAPLHQVEFDTMSDFAYQYGTGALCQSSIVSRANAGDYAGSCEAYKLYRFVGKGENRYDCSTLVNGKPNKRCYGVWTRQLGRYEACTGAL
jgi:lysozyme